MNTENRLRGLFSSPWLLSVIPSVLIILLLPSLATRYTLKVEDLTKGFASYVFYDLNSDGITELMNSGKGLPHSFVAVLNNDIRIYDQWNIEEDFIPGISEIFFGNYDNDRYSEIYVFSVRNDSLFLNANEFFDAGGLKFNRMFVTRICMLNGTITSHVGPAGFYDRNKDGFQDLYFVIQTGFGLEPRYIYSFDFVNRKLLQSQFTGAIFQFPVFCDADDDGKPEILGTSHAAGNYNIPSPYSDWSSWVMVFNENLEFEFPPIGYKGITNGMQTLPYSSKGSKGYIVSYNTSSADSAVHEPGIILLSVKGEKIREKKYSDLGLNGYVLCFSDKSEPSDRIFVFEKELLELNDNLEIVNREEAPFDHFYSCLSEDLNNDGKKEYLFYSDKLKRISVYNSDLKKIAESDLNSSLMRHRISRATVPGKPDRFLMTNIESANILELQVNKNYYTKFLAHPGIYLLMVLFIYLIKRITVSQVEQREKLKQRLLTLQLQGIKSQLDPHFTFNALNSIASLIYLEERQAAYDHLNKFTRLLRVMLNDAERIYRTLNEELEFLNTYLELEKLRFGNKLSYSVDLGPGVTGDEKVPKLVLHTFAENAIKHGIVPGDQNGMLRISICREGDCLKINIEDNGIGREKAAGNILSTGKGLKLTGEFYDILNQLNKRSIYYSITDLYDDSGQACGTRVEISVPVE